MAVSSWIALWLHFSNFALYNILNNFYMKCHGLQSLFELFFQMNTNEPSYEDTLSSFRHDRDGSK